MRYYYVDVWYEITINPSVIGVVIIFITDGWETGIINVEREKSLISWQTEKDVMSSCHDL